ncbi:MAG: HAD-IB family phosphatase [Crenarchaeota archaeon]|nr:HAD-IB family phosphatase [Thermoproteota archaeon]
MKLFIFDFDGTVVKKDTTDLILEIPAKKEVWQVEEAWRNGKISSYQCMKEQAKFLKGVSLDKIYGYLKEHSSMDLDFPELVRFLKEKGFYSVVLSEGYDVSLDLHQIRKYIGEIHCSKLLLNNGVATGELEVSNEKKWNYNKECIGCCICKVDFLHQIKQKFDITKTFAVGDGGSDGCLFQYVDVSFSLNPRYKATFQVKNLGDVVEILRKSL